MDFVTPEGEASSSASEILSKIVPSRLNETVPATFLSSASGIHHVPIAEKLSMFPSQSMCALGSGLMIPLGCYHPRGRATLRGFICSRTNSGLPANVLVRTSPPHYGDTAGHPTVPALIYAILGAGLVQLTSTVVRPAIVPDGVDANQLPPWANEVLSADPYICFA